jgi:type I restriction enzyme, S subunit
MREWRTVEIEHVCSLIVDCVNKTAPIVVQTTPYRMVRTTNIRNGRIDLSECRCVEKETFAKWTRRANVEDGDVLLTREAPIGEVGYVSGHGKIFLGQRIMQYRANPELLDPRFLLYAFLSPKLQHQFGAHEGSGSVVSHIRVGDCFKFKIPLPPIETQRDIARILGALDDKIELNRQINQTLEQIAQAIFKSWFVDFEPVKAKIEAKVALTPALSQGEREIIVERAAMCAISGKLEPELDQLPPEQRQQLAATAALFPDELVESELGLIPEGWEVSEIGKEVTVVGGGTPSTANPDFWNGEFAWVTPKDLSRLSEKVLVGSERTISANGVRKISSGQLPVGTVLLSSRAPIGYLALTMIPVSINQGFIAMRCDKRLPNTYILQWATESLDAIKQRGSGTTFAEISKSNFRAMSVLVPGAEALDAFQQLVLPLYEQITASVHEAETLATLRDTLLPKLLSGELSVGSQEVASAMETAV